MSASGESNFDEGDDSDISKVDDPEVKMDLTDDLLHMVCFGKWIVLVLTAKNSVFHDTYLKSVVKNPLLFEVMVFL